MLIEAGAGCVGHNWHMRTTSKHAHKQCNAALSGVLKPDRVCGEGLVTITVIMGAYLLRCAKCPIRTDTQS